MTTYSLQEQYRLSMAPIKKICCSPINSVKIRPASNFANFVNGYSRSRRKLSLQLSHQQYLNLLSLRHQLQLLQLRMSHQLSVVGVMTQLLWTLLRSDRKIVGMVVVVVQLQLTDAITLVVLLHQIADVADIVPVLRKVVADIIIIIIDVPILVNAGQFLVTVVPSRVSVGQLLNSITS